LKITRRKAIQRTIKVEIFSNPRSTVPPNSKTATVRAMLRYPRASIAPPSAAPGTLPKIAAKRAEAEAAAHPGHPDPKKAMRIITVNLKKYSAWFLGPGG
jgi:hypothetical protein